MTIGFRDTNENASVVLGILSGFNLWSYAMTAEEILRMSHGCGGEEGDVKAWETVRKGLKKEVAVEWFRTCNDRKGDRVVVDANSTLFNQSAVLVSPPYNRSRDWHSKCLRFRYMLRGPGEKTMTIYQKTSSYREIPIWVSKINTGQNWIYGQVPLSSVSEFQISIKGETEKKEDLIALTGLYIEEGKHCKFKPQLAKQACSENLFNMSGYFFSPSFPGYYLDDIFCTWHITVPFLYTIRLEFQEFRLKDHPTCENCFLEIFDGRDTTAPAIGRFCGYVYPPVFVSSSNHFTIVLSCHGNLRVARFKAFYHLYAAHDDKEPSCSRQQGCPSSCKCEEFGEDQDKKLLMTGEDLLTVPSNLPFNTGAVFFKQNRISQLREKDLANLTKLEYIDMSFNILLHLDGGSFQNVSSVNTLRLNSNFFRTLPAGAFTGLPNLRVLDLGRNLLRKVTDGMFDGLSSLEVLSLRSNQIEGLEYGVFDNKSNMTHLYLQNNKLTTLPNGLFGALSKLKVLDLSSNELTTVTKDTFQGLKSLEYLYLNSNRLSDVPSDAFSELKNMKYLKLDRFILCCYAKKSIEGVDCDSPVDEFSSCDDLMKNNTLQICIWILGILAFRTKRSLNRKRKNVTSLVLKSLTSQIPGRKQSVDWLKTSDDVTLVTNVIAGSSPLSFPRVSGTQERDSKQVHANLRLIEEANILRDDTAGKRSTGYAVAWCEEGSFLSMVLLKYFAKEFKEDWIREVDMVKSMSRRRELISHLLHYRWHSKARDQSIEHGKVKIREIYSNSLLICYDFVSSSTLEDFLCEKGTVLNFDAVCAIACDVISAIERLQDLGILHNNITTSNILIGQCARLPPIRAVLGGFSRASKMNEAGAYTNWAVAEQSNYGNDIEQFGQLLATLLGHCHGSSEYTQLHEIMNLCFEETVENRPQAAYIRELLEDVWYCVGVWDTCL
ncbi:hypothetical protein OS493_024874 [Desmophyllum pertusum]|uniref:Protein kinase domain-containing protein n=1 Tax=Desmophyllum pertusum TaxID=174260 RepID=A0A9X0CS73_9CNID|nr:hypothetical protein OS493_024874 [Desmophyllum pertusum]